MRDTANALVRVLLAPICPGCSAELEHPLDARICDGCWASIPQLPQPACARCGDALGPGAADLCCARCRETPPPYEVARSAGRHDGSLRAIVHAFKYRRHRLLAEPLGHLMRERGRDVLDGADAVVPVPLHPIRSLKRGFNQADDLARQLGLPVWRALQRRTHGRMQARLAAAERRDRLARAYATSLVWQISGRRARALAGATIVLVDDVMTTGATVEACSRVLQAAGVSAVRVLTAARAVTERPIERHLPRLHEDPRR